MGECMNPGSHIWAMERRRRAPHREGHRTTLTLPYSVDPANPSLRREQLLGGVPQPLAICTPPLSAFLLR